MFIPTDAGLGHHTLVYSYTDPVTGCSNEIAYNITVLNKCAGPVVSTTSTESTSSSTEAPGSITKENDGSSSNIGVIVGSVVGALVFLCCIVVIAFFLLKRKKRQNHELERDENMVALSRRVSAMDMVDYQLKDVEIKKLIGSGNFGRSLKNFVMLT